MQCIESERERERQVAQHSCSGRRQPRGAGRARESVLQFACHADAHIYLENAPLYNERETHDIVTKAIIRKTNTNCQY